MEAARAVAQYPVVTHVTLEHAFRCRKRHRADPGFPDGLIPLAPGADPAHVNDLGDHDAEAEGLGDGEEGGHRVLKLECTRVEAGWCSAARGGARRGDRTPTRHAELDDMQ